MASTNPEAAYRRRRYAEDPEYRQKVIERARARPREQKAAYNKAWYERVKTTRKRKNWTPAKAEYQKRYREENRERERAHARANRARNAHKWRDLKLPILLFGGMR